MAVVFDSEQEKLLHKLLDTDIEVMTKSAREWSEDVVMRKAREHEIEVALRCKRDLSKN